MVDERTPLTGSNGRTDDEAETENKAKSKAKSLKIGGIVSFVLLLGIIGYYSYWNTHPAKQTVIVNEKVPYERIPEASYRDGCKYYPTTGKPPKILQTSMHQAGQPWSWLDCELVSSHEHTITLNSAKAPDALLVVNLTAATNRNPKILGFGGAFTEASALNFRRLTEESRNMVLELLFGSSGLGYSLGRIPIHSCDFSVSSYNFDSVEDDFKLEYFDESVSHDVSNGMIPFIQAAMQVAEESFGNQLTLFGSPWSPPAWMKQPTEFDPPGVLHAQKMTHSTQPTCLRGRLDNEDMEASKYARAWANYIAKWIHAYDNHNISISAVTVQNEPEFPAPWEACAYSAANMTDFVAYHLGVVLGNSTDIWAFDHNKDHVDDWMQVMLNTSESSATARNYVKGTGYHWYAGGMDRLLDGALGNANLHRLREDLNAMGLSDHLVLGTEACHCPSTGYAGGDINVYWSRAERYAHTILADLAAGSQGWVEWNLILDSFGGPNHLGNLCDSSMLSVPHRAVDATADVPAIPDFEYHDPIGGQIKGDNRTREELNAMGFPAQYIDYGIAVQPIFHYMGHISRYVRPGSQSVPALIHASLGQGEIFRPVGTAVAGGGENDLARNGIELTAWPCEGSTRQHFRWNDRTGTISVAGHSWLGDPTESCFAMKNDKDLKGLRLVDCTTSKKYAGLFDLVSIAGDAHQRVTMQLRNGQQAGKCVSILELANKGGSYGPMGGAQIALGDCSMEASKWVVDKAAGTAKSMYFWTAKGETHPLRETKDIELPKTVCMTTGWPFLQMGAFYTPKGTSPHTLVLLNEAKDSANYAVTEHGDGIALTGSIPSRSIQTILLEKGKAS